jgi:hypothetical protein
MAMPSIDWGAVLTSVQFGNFFGGHLGLAPIYGARAVIFEATWHIRAAYGACDAGS